MITPLPALLEENPIIIAIKDEEGLARCLQNPKPVVFVLYGSVVSIPDIVRRLKEAGAKRCVPLQVSGPFHSPMLSGAGEKLQEALTGVEVFDPIIPYVANVTADYVTKKEEIKPLLARQVSASRASA